MNTEEKQDTLKFLHHFKQNKRYYNLSDKAKAKLKHVITVITKELE